MQGVKIQVGHVLDQLRKLDDESVHCVVTSPPYWGLRTYGTEPQLWPDGWKGELSSEPDLNLFIAHLVLIFDEVRRVLRKDGTCWINIGDGYNSSKPKDLCLIPQRLAIALQESGWWIRSDIIWAKKNGLPESVKDRPTRRHEYIFLCTKSAKYWYDAGAIRTPHSKASKHRACRGTSSTNKNAAGEHRPPDTKAMSIHQKQVYQGYENIDERVATGDTALNSLGANARTVWPMPNSCTHRSHSFPGAHFATFPPELPRRCILAGCPEKVCTVCGKGWVRKVKRSGGTTGKSWHNHKTDDLQGQTQVHGDDLRRESDSYHVESLGFFPACDCNPPHDGNDPCGHCGAPGFHADCEPCFSRGLVLDPFVGSGTTCMVAAQLGRNSIGIELNPDYAKMAVERIHADAPLLNEVTLCKG